MKKNCSYCNTKSNLLFQSKDYNRKVTNTVFDHYKCPKCKLIFIDPIPENLGDYYPQTYYSIPDSVDVLKSGFAHERYKIEIIQRFIKQGRLLEIGPSLGCFTYLAKHSGFDAEAIEMDARCSKFLNEIANIPTVNSDNACEALKTLPPFDVIALWHVIEHLPNPWETLEAIVKSLNKGGVVVIAAPNPDAFQFKVLGRYWPHVDAPRHVMLIPSSLIIEKLESLGMKLEYNTTNDEGGLGWNIFGWEFFFSNLSSQPRINRYLHSFGRKVAKVFGVFDRLEGKGSAYTIVLRKVE
ncbi:class I SAM-dependent methyltransferase [Methylotenera sp.]|uniref:class I SAM-dependent methyltransferase n=1 Tax=Methylotenera sp. TaxID=2051956 RepID=UPI002488681A|nr:class I SAM-dependent methyltransferase [Methylotenera sp.]MDI1299685.1 class I SAM-dependent methyltransferase [Methylotenera sp.]